MCVHHLASFAMLPRPVVIEALDVTPLHLVKHHHLPLVREARSNSHMLPSMGRMKLGTIHVLIIF
jgi:hypothetical protein